MEQDQRGRNPGHLTRYKGEETYKGEKGTVTKFKVERGFIHRKRKKNKAREEVDKPSIDITDV